MASQGSIDTVHIGIDIENTLTGRERDNSVEITTDIVNRGGPHLLGWAGLWAHSNLSKMYEYILNNVYVYVLAPLVTKVKWFHWLI